MNEHDFTGADHFCRKCRAWSFGQQAGRECVSVPAADPVRADDAPADEVNYFAANRDFS